MQLLGCFDCGAPEHWAENCPELEPVTTKAGHLARIDQYVQWMWDGRITARQKQELIKAEVKRWKAMQPKAKGKAA